MPPVHDVSFGVLVRAAVEYARPRRRAVHREQVHCVLELVPEAERPAALIQRRAREHAANQRLIHRPAVHVPVEFRIRRSKAYARAQPGIVLERALKGRLRLGRPDQGAQRAVSTAAADDDERLCPRQLHAKAGYEPGAGLPAGVSGRPRGLVASVGHGLVGKRGGKLHAASPVFGAQHAVFHTRRGKARVARLGRQLQRSVPEHLARRVFYYKHPRGLVRRHKGRDARAELFPARIAEAVFHSALLAGFVGKQARRAAARHDLERLRPRGRALGADPLVHAPFARVVRPHIAEAAVCGQIAEASVRKRQRPRLFGQRSAHGEAKRPIAPAVFNFPAAPRRAQRRAQGESGITPFGRRAV